jgi:hypothetical protein
MPGQPHPRQFQTYQAYLKAKEKHYQHWSWRASRRQQSANLLREKGPRDPWIQKLFTPEQIQQVANTWERIATDYWITANTYFTPAGYEVFVSRQGGKLTVIDIYEKLSHTRKEFGLCYKPEYELDTRLTDSDLED